MFKKIKTALLGMLVAALPATAQTQQEDPMFTFEVSTAISESVNFSFSIGATEKMFIDVDFGYGATEQEVDVAVSDPEAGITGTFISGNVVKGRNVVKVYGDPTKIDYLSLSGIGITKLDITKLTNLEFLYLSHNQLESLDLTPNTKLLVIDVEDNPFDKSPFVVGTPKADLTMLSISNIGAIDDALSLRDYPKLQMFDAFACRPLKTCDPTGCPNIKRISLDLTSVSTLDVTKNPELLILNISGCRITDIDLSKNAKLTEFYCSRYGSLNGEYKFTSIDVTNNPELYRLYCSGNLLTELDLSKNPKLFNLNCSHNLLKSIDLTANPDLYTVDISYNLMDFATMPAPRMTWNEYWFDQQPMELNRSYPVGTVIDLSKRVMREDGTTTARLMVRNELDPGTYKALPDEYFKFEAGKVTLQKSYNDSIYINYSNTTLPDYDLRTSSFMVKEAADFGKDNLVVALRRLPGNKKAAFKIGILGATAETPKKFSVDFGKGGIQEFTATTSEIPAEPNASTEDSGTDMKVYMPEGTDITAFAIDGMQLNYIDLDAAPTLQYLSLTNCRLPAIDLPWNRCLRSLDLSDNGLTELDLTGGDGDNGKNVLTDIRAPRNKLTKVTLSDGRTPRLLDLADNDLKEFSLENASNLIELYLANNKLESLNLEYCESLATLDVSGNMLSALPIPLYTPLKNLKLEGNRIPLPALPAVSKFDSYSYAPQQVYAVPEKAPTVNLSEHWLDNEGHVTAFEWRRVEDNRVLTDAEVSMNEGHHRFLDPSVGKVYCVWSHPDFPDFKDDNIYRSTEVLTAEMPTHVVATFKTLEAGEATLTLAGAQPQTTVYVDWSGKLDLEQCVLETTYKHFKGTREANAEVKVYSYDENDGVTVFSLSAGPLEYIDASKMKGLKAFSCSGSGLTSDKISLPASAALEELTLSGAKLKTFDFSNYAGLRLIDVSHNEIEEIDLSKYKALESFYAPYNKIRTTKFDNPRLWELALVENDLSEISLAGLPALSQVFLTNNKLSAIDLENLPALRVVHIDKNRFTFATLPLPKDQWTINYHYGLQEPLKVEVVDGKVDLSSQVKAGDTPTVYRWFVDTPYFDENNQLVGEELVAGEEYKVENGVTTFLADNRNIMCVMTNEKLPELYLYTNFLDVTGISAVGDIAGDASEAIVSAGVGRIDVLAAEGMPVSVWTIDGAKVREAAGPASFESLSADIYVVKAGEKTVKVLVR